MLTYRQLLKTHHRLLLIDSASTSIQVALLQRDAEPVWCAKSGEAGVQLFAGIEEVLARAGSELAAVDAFVYCDGPGSVLGIRTAAVALRTWNVLRERPVYAFCGLSVVAHVLAQDGRRNFAVIADARRDHWHHVAVDANGAVSLLHRLPVAALSGALFMPEGFRHWTPLPSQVQSTPYAIAALLPRVADIELFDPAAEPDAFLHEEPVYRTWTPQIHRAPL